MTIKASNVVEVTSVLRDSVTKPTIDIGDLKAFIAECDSAGLGNHVLVRSCTPQGFLSDLVQLVARRTQQTS